MGFGRFFRRAFRAVSDPFNAGRKVTGFVKDVTGITAAKAAQDAAKAQQEMAKQQAEEAKKTSDIANQQNIIKQKQLEKLAKSRGGMRTMGFFEDSNSSGF